MGEKIIEYEVSIGFDTAIRKLSQLETKMKGFNKSQESALRKQINLQKQLNRLKSRKIKGGGISGGGVVDSRVKDINSAREQADTENLARISRHTANMEEIQEKALREDRKRNKINEGTSKRVGNINTARTQADTEERARQAKAAALAAKEAARAVEKESKGTARTTNNRNKAVTALRRTAMWQNEVTTEAEKEAKQRFISNVNAARTADEVRDIVAAERQRLRVARQQERSLKKQSFFMRRMVQSSRQMAGSLVGAFALAAGGAFVARTGAAFQAVDNSLLAVSGSAEKAGQDLAFVREQAFRLGKPLKDSAKAFVRLKAAQGDVSDTDLKTIFVGVQEMATVLGLTADESNRANVAIGQMLSKGKVTAEELKNQLAESGLANAIQEMVKAAQDIGLIDKELSLTQATAQFSKLQEQGLVISEKILPRFGQRLKNAAAPSLNKALDEFNVGLGRLMFTMEDASNSIFKAGFGKNITKLMNTLAELIKDNADLWIGIGNLAGRFFRILSDGIQAASPTLQAFGSIIMQTAVALDTMTESGLKLQTLSTVALLLIARFKPILFLFGAIAIAIQNAIIFAEEFANIFTGEKEGVLRGKGEIVDVDFAAGKAKGFGEIVGKGGGDTLTKVAAILASSLKFKDFESSQQFIQKAGSGGSIFDFKKEPRTINNVTVKVGEDEVAATIFNTPAAQNAIGEAAALQTQ